MTMRYDMYAWYPAVLAVLYAPPLSCSLLMSGTSIYSTFNSYDVHNALFVIMHAMRLRVFFVRGKPQTLRIPALDPF